jgi:hypothetical protein
VNDLFKTYNQYNPTLVRLQVDEHNGVMLNLLPPHPNFFGVGLQGKRGQTYFRRGNQHTARFPDLQKCYLNLKTHFDLCPVIKIKLYYGYFNDVMQTGANINSCALFLVIYRTELSCN